MMPKKAHALDLVAEFQAANDHDASLPSAKLRLEEEVAEMEPVISAAVLVTAAFRLKDERGLIAALRRLATAVDVLEHQRDPD